MIKYLPVDDFMPAMAVHSTDTAAPRLAGEITRVTVVPMLLEVFGLGGDVGTEGGGTLGLVLEALGREGLDPLPGGYLLDGLVVREVAVVVLLPEDCEQLAGVL